MEVFALWENTLEILRKEMHDSAFNGLKDLLPVGIDSQDHFQLALPTQGNSNILRTWLEKNYSPRISMVLSEQLGRPITVELIEPFKESAGSELPPPIAPPILPAEPKSATKPTSEVRETVKMVGGKLPFEELLNPRYTYNSFVVGDTNQFAYAASLGVCENPGHQYNPLFLYGDSGLGKTHLMHAMGHKIKEKFPHLRIVYLTTETFTNEVINAIRDNTTEALRSKYRSVDVLMIDDIQFLSNKDRTQEEFFHTFNTLQQANKHIIITSDRPPKEIPSIEERLRSRFEGGLMADIQSPDFETRTAILRKKAYLDNCSNIPDEVLSLIAGRINTNIRELEGALTRVIVFASAQSKPVTVELASRALGDLFPENRSTPLTIEKIQKFTAEYFNLKPEALSSKKKTQQLAFARQIAMYLAREQTSQSLPKIGEAFGGRDHTTVMHACQKIGRQREVDPRVDKVLLELLGKIEKG
jgi:chromosomal replication initiator protein DnaA